MIKSFSLPPFMKGLLVLFLFSVIYFLAVPFVYAQVTCQPIYGGGQSCVVSNNMIINKTVLNPQTNQFVENLSINDPKYQPGFITTFQISVTNAGNTNISEADIKDVFPQHISFSSGPGTFDPVTNTLSFTINDLQANETRRFTILGRVLNADQIPVAVGSVICVVNQAVARIDSGSTSQDNAQLCIEKTAAPIATTKGGFPVVPGIPPTTSPQTGPESLALIALIPALGAGMFLRRMAKKN